MLRDSLRRRLRGRSLPQSTVLVLLGVAVPVMFAATFVQLRTETPAIHVPSNVAWTERTLAIASNGTPFADRCWLSAAITAMASRASATGLPLQISPPSTGLLFGKNYKTFTTASGSHR